MKMSEIDSLGLLPQTKADVRLDPTKLIVDDEFRRSGHGDYRKSAIKRLVDNKLPITSECNIVHILIQGQVEMTCPYCTQGPMKASDGSGCGTVWTAIFKCSWCGASATLTVQSDGLSFYPPKKP